MLRPPARLFACRAGAGGRGRRQAGTIVMTIWTRLRQMMRSEIRTDDPMPPRPRARKSTGIAGTASWSWIPGWDGAWGGRSLAARVEAGYRRNPVAFRCVRLIAECAASVPLRLLRGGAVITHPVHQRLVHQPSPALSGTAFFERLYTLLLLAGEAYLLRLPEDRPDDPQEFHLLPPERMRREGRGRGPWPARYVLEGEERRRV
ncbi:MAG: phage portal protein, partial [Alphaproteobacteria bacterium]